MIKISIEDLKNVEKRLSFYDFKNHKSKKKKIVVSFDNVHVVRYGDIEYGANAKTFFKQAQILQDLIVGLCEYFGEQVLLKKYHNRWIVNPKLSETNFTSSIKELGKRLDFKGGIILTDTKIIKEFILENLKYNSFTYFILQKAEVIIVPTDHMDIFIAANEVEKCYEIIKQIINKLEKSHVLKAKII